MRAIQPDRKPDSFLFLDQRLLRQRIRDYSEGRRVLNLFCYTGTATVYAAAGKAVHTTSVDMSNTYLAWAEKNLALNGFRGRRNLLVRADCLRWIEKCREQYDLIFLSPPTFSNSKKMKGAFDIQRDHAVLLEKTLGLLAPGGLLIFSCSRRKFRIDREAMQGWNIKEISSSSVPKDFSRKKRMYYSFEIGDRIE